MEILFSTKLPMETYGFFNKKSAFKAGETSQTLGTLNTMPWNFWNSTKLPIEPYGFFSKKSSSKDFKFNQSPIFTGAD